MRSTRKIVVISLLSMLILASIGPFSFVYARRTLTITLDYNQTFGDVSPDPAEVDMCKDITFTITPKAGCHIQQLYVDAEGPDPNFTPINGVCEYTLTKVKAPHTLHVVFSEVAELELSDPDLSTVILGVLGPTSGEAPFGFEYLPGTLEGLSAAQFFIEVTGTLSGTATITVHYDDSVFGGDTALEGQLRLYVGNVVDFNGDLTINGNDIAAINAMVGTEVDEETPPEIAIFDVNGDGIVDDVDVNIVKEYANSGLVVSPGNYFGDGEFRVAWIDITKGQNTDDNTIWGETWHLSLFGVR